MKSMHIHKKAFVYQYCLVFLMVLMVTGISRTTNAQVTGSGAGCVLGNWGIDAGLYSGVIEYGAGTGTGSNDWFLGTSTPPGRGIIDQSDYTALQLSLQATGNPTYERRMKYGLVSKEGGQILIDGVYARDKFGGTGYTDPTSYNTASKNGEDPAIWDPGEMNVLGKNDIIDVGGHMFRDGYTLSSDLWFVGLFNMAEPGGTSYMDFEFFVEEVTLSGTGNDIIFTSGGPQIGHTAYQFDSPGRITKIGDFIFSVSISGSGGPIVETRLWVSYADWVRLNGPTLGSTPTFTWAGTYDGAYNGSPYGYAGINPLIDGKVCGYLNADLETPLAPPWGSKGTKTNSYITNYIPFSIAEVGINLTAFGMDHSSLLGEDQCYFPLHTYLVKTRASASFTAQLKDFAGPYSWGQAQFNLVFDNTLISCNSSTSTITAYPQRDDVIYNWSTIDGHIVGIGAHPWELIVDQVGTYTLNVELPNGCSVPSGSVTVNLDLTKPFFDGPPTFSYTIPCNTNDGTVTVTASGATKPYTFTLYKDNVQVTQVTKGISESTHTFTGLEAGNYRVDVKGVYACIETTGPFTIPGKVPVNISETLTHVNCFGNKTGAINLSVTGGNPPLSYLWSTGNTSEDLLNIGAGNYTVNITDHDGCVTSATFSITEPPALSGNITKTDDPGNGGTGSATISVTGGTPTYNYEWTKTPNPAVIGTSATLSSIGYGEYKVKVTDANGCTATFTTFIYEKEICNDGIDNDGDGLNNCDDPDCVPEQPGTITAEDATPCVDPDGTVPYTFTYTYSVPENSSYDSYFWSVPVNAVIVSGQNTREIEVVWLTTAGGQICVQGKKFNCLSTARCINVIVDNVPPQPGQIILNNN